MFFLPRLPAQSGHFEVAVAVVLSLRLQGEGDSIVLPALAPQRGAVCQISSTAESVTGMTRETE